MSEKNNSNDQTNIEVKLDMSEFEKKTPQVEFNADKEIEKIRQAESNRTSQIRAMGEKAELRNEADEAIKSGMTEENFRKIVIDKMIERGQAKKIDTSADVGLSQNEVKRYSFIRAINALVTGDWSKAGFERECSLAVGKKNRKEARGFFIPEEVLRRDLTVGTATAGGNTVATDLLSGSFIELLRNRMITRQLGATVLSGLQGNVAIPSQTGGATAYWVDEGSSPTESQQTFGQLTLQPRTCGAFTDISRKLLIQSSSDIENLVISDLASVLAIELDRVAINGSGTAPEPTGILNTSGIGNVGTSPAALTYANVVELWKDVAVENAAIGSLAYLTNPLVCAKAMQTFTNATYGEMPIWVNGPGDGSMLGYRAAVSNQCPSNLSSSTAESDTADSDLSAMIFGNFNDLVIAEWSGIDVTVDPYSASTSGTVRIVCLMDADIGVRHAASFSAMKEITTD